MSVITSSKAAEFVLSALKNLEEEAGCSVKQICDFIGASQDYSKEVIKKAVDKALRAGVTFGVITRVSRGYYALTQFEGFLKRRNRKYKEHDQRKAEPEVREIHRRIPKDKERKNSRHKKHPKHQNKHKGKDEDDDTKCERCKHKQKEKCKRQKHKHAEKHRRRPETHKKRCRSEETSRENTPPKSEEKQSRRSGEESKSRPEEKSNSRSGEKSNSRSGEKSNSRSGEKSNSRSGEKSKSRSREKSNSRIDEGNKSRSDEENQSRSGNKTPSKNSKTEENKAGSADTIFPSSKTNSRKSNEDVFMQEDDYEEYNESNTSIGL